MDWNRLSDEATRYLQDYIRIDTVNPPGNEVAGARFLEKVFEKDSIPCEIFEPAPGRGSILATLKGSGEKKPILLLSQGNIALEKVLKKTKNGFIVPYSDIEQIILSLRQFLQTFLDRGKIDVEIDDEEVRSYSSIEMVRKLSEILDGLVKFGKGKTSIT